MRPYFHSLGVQSRHLVDRVKNESFRLGCPDFADVFVGREAVQGLQSACEVVGREEVGEVCLQLVVAVVVEPFHSRVLDRSVHPFDLTVGPRMIGLGQPVLDPVGLADHVESHRPGGDGIPVPGLLCELDATIGKNRVDLIGHGFEHVLQELPGGLSVSRCNELGDGELGRSVNAHKEIELAFSRLYLGDVDMEKPDGVAFELLALGLVTLDIQKTRDPMPLQAAMQR